MKKRFLCLFLILSLLGSLTFVNTASDNSDKEISKIEAKSIVCDEVFSTIFVELNLERMYESDAPSDYAVIYADENGTLVLCVANGSANKYENIVNNIVSRKTTAYALQTFETDEAPIVRVEEKEFTYNLLNTIQDALDPKMSTFKIQQTAIKQEKNVVEITIEDELLIEEISQYLYGSVSDFNPEAVDFIVAESEKVVPTANYAYNGVKFYHTLFASTYGTLGFNGSYTDSSGKVHYGVFTNAHVAPVGEKMKISALKTVGTTLFSYVGGSLDIAFVEFNSGWAVTDKMLSASDTNAIYSAATASEFYEGALTNKYGATTGKQSGKILSTSVSIDVEYDSGNKLITDVFKFSNKTEGGDSGGPVGKQQTKQVFRLYGITFAGPKNTNTYGYGIKLSNIKKAYNIKVYGTNGWS